MTTIKCYDTARQVVRELSNIDGLDLRVSRPHPYPDVIISKPDGKLNIQLRIVDGNMQQETTGNLIHEFYNNRKFWNSYFRSQMI